MVDDADFTDGIVALFDDTDASECLHERKPMDTVCFDIHRFVADCQSAMHYVDASSYAVAGYVVQCDDAGDDHPVAFFSSKLSASERNWSTTEREAYAALLTVKKYREWLFGSKIIFTATTIP